MVMYSTPQAVALAKEKKSERDKVRPGDAIHINRDDAAKREYLFNYDAYDDVRQYVADFIQDALNSDIALRMKDARDRLASVKITDTKTLEIYYQDYAERYFTFRKAVRNGGIWDIKRNAEFRQLCIPANRMNGDLVYVTPIRGDTEYLYYYDIWGNILYGYLGKWCEILETALYAGSWWHNQDQFLEIIFAQATRSLAELGDQMSNAGRDSDADQVSVNIGIQLANNGIAPTSVNLHQAVFEARTKWQGSTVRLPWKILYVKSAQLN